jgi:hypothetical protein
MSDCIPCNNPEYKRKYHDIDKTKTKAAQWAKAQGYIGILVIVINPSSQSYGFRKPDCECLTGPDALTEVDRIYID